MGATLSSRAEWTSAGGSTGKLDFSRNNEQLLQDISSYVETITNDHLHESEVQFQRPFIWTTSLPVSVFSTVSSDDYDISDAKVESKKKDEKGDPLFSIAKDGDHSEIRASSFKELQTVLKYSGDKKLSEVQHCLECNQDPIGIIMGPAFATTSSGVSNAVLEAHKALSREQARGKDGGNLDSRFRLLLLLNALDTKLLHNSVQKLGKGIRLSPEAVETEYGLISQFCGSSNTNCLEHLQYTTDDIFSNGCRAPPWRQVFGDICYFKIKPLDGDVFYVTACTEGYFVNKGMSLKGEMQYEKVGQVCTTLLELLKGKSRHFADTIGKQEFIYHDDRMPQETAQERVSVSYDVEFTEEKETKEIFNSREKSDNKQRSPPSRKSTEGKKKALTPSSAFKTAPSSQKWRNLNLGEEEEDNLFVTSKTRLNTVTPKKASQRGTRKRENIDGMSPPQTAKSQVTIKSRGASQYRSITGATGLFDEEEEESDSSTDGEEEEQTEHKLESSADLPSEYWQIQKLLKYLKGGNQTATIIALCSLLDFDLKQDTSQMAIRDVGGMDLLVNLLETSDIKCKIGALKILREITHNTQTRIDITNLGGVPLMIQILKSPNRELKCLASETIANVANVKRARRIVRHHFGIKKLVSLLESPGRPGTPSTGQRSDIEVACCAASALWSCSKSKKNKLAMLKAGIVPLLAQHLQADEERLLVPIIGTIQECASEKVYQELVRSEGMIEHLVRGLKKENKELQMHCAAAIFKCAEDPATRDMVREFGGLSPLARLLAIHDPMELLVAVTGAVWKCSMTMKNVKEFKGMKVVEHLIELLNKKSENVLVNVVGAIGECAKDADNRVTIRKGGGLPPMVQLLTGTNQALLINVTKAIEASAKEPESMVVIDKSDGVRLLWSLLKSSNPEVQASAAWAICPCIENCKDSGELVRSFVGGLELIVGLLKSPHTEVLASVCAALAKIAQDEENLGVITDHGVVPLLAKLTTTQDDHLRRHLADAVARCCAWGNNRVTFGNESAVAPLVHYLDSTAADVHRSTAQALYQLSKDPKNCVTMHEQGVVKSLLVMVGSLDEALQEAAAGCISNIRHLALANEKAKFV